MLRFLLIFLSIFLFANEKPITLQLDWIYQFEFAGFIMAKEKGFYKEAGLNVKLKEWDGKTDIVNEVLQNQNMIGLSTTSLFDEIVHHKPIEILMPTLKESPAVLGIVGYKNIDSLQDLIKYHIPISNHIKDVMPIIAMLKKNHIDINKLNFVDFKIGDFKHKKGAFLFYLSNEPYFLNQQHIPYHIFDPKDYGFSSYGNILFTSQKFARKNTQTIKNFLEATKKGFDYAFNHIDETINIILKKYNPNKTYDQLKFEANVLKPLLGFSFDMDRMECIKNRYLLSGIIDVNLNQYMFSKNILKISTKSKQFIKNHPIKVITTTTWLPFHFKVNGQLKGIDIDYWKLIAKKTHLKSDFIIAPNFTKALNSIKNKQADILLGIGKTKEREKYALFSKPYVSFPFVIATRNNIGFVENLDMYIMKNKIIAVGKNYTAEKILKKHYPNIKLLEVENTKKALEMVEKGKAFGAVDILPVIAYQINEHQFSTIKISGKLPYNFDVRFMIRKDFPELVEIINKAIDSISIAQKMKISQKWVPIIYEKGFSFESIKKYLIIGCLILIILIVWIILKIQNEKKLTKAKERAEKAEKIKSEFLANMSHEIRTPLNAMFGFIQLLKDKELDKEAKKYLNIIERSGKILLTIINDILDFSKLEAGKLHIEMVEFNPKEEIDILYNLFKTDASNKGIELKVQEDLKYNIISDPTRLKQVISNLLSNAIKFTEKGKIYLIAKYDDKNEKLYIEVKDEGIGIEKEKLSNIFQAFTQADSSTTRKYGGTGLGLTISYKLVELLGGELKVESEKNKGSRFYFEIPVKKTTPIKNTKKTIKPIKTKKYHYHILVVEDNKANQMFITVLLKKLGLTFDVANDGLEAIEMFKKNNYDLILMDENMPNMNGIKATQEIRKIQKEQDLKHTIIVALTANALEGDKERFILAGMDYYLSKPLDIEKLKEILDKLEK